MSEEDRGEGGVEETSRLIVKNLPTNVGEEELKGHFGGEVTDVKVMRTRDGKSRGIAFVGFRTVEEARRVREGFDGTFYLTRRILVEYAQIRGSMRLDRPWSRYSVGSSRYKVEMALKDGDAMGSEGDVDIELLSRSGRLFVTNLTYSVTVEDLEGIFGGFGEMSDVHIIVDRLSGQGRGMAFVQYFFPVHAINAYNGLNGSIFQGRIIKVVPAQEMPSKVQDTSLGEQGVSFQSEYQKKKIRKIQELRDHDFNWNSLFVRSDVAVDATALRLNIDKSQILDSKSQSSMAVHVALSETNIINENKQFLQAQGVSLDALQRHNDLSITRSNTTILIKNIPPNTSIDDLTSLFARFGDIHKLVMPPARTMALVDFSNSNDAKCAFKSLAYKNFGNSPLFLEWAPIGIIEKKDPQQPSTTSNSKLETLQNIIQRTSRTIFVKNLSFDTNEIRLKNHFQSKIGGVIHASIALHKVGNKTLSHGFGFVEFKDHHFALEAWKTLNNSTLDGHQLKLQFSKNSQLEFTKNLHHSASKRKPPTSINTHTKSSKLAIKNVPFECNKKELHQLFSSFGELKSIRLPQKPGGTGHRGFAFVEYTNNHDASNAMNELTSTHLYGRRLIVEYSMEDDD